MGWAIAGILVVAVTVIVAIELTDPSGPPGPGRVVHRRRAAIGCLVLLASWCALGLGVGAVAMLINRAVG